MSVNMSLSGCSLKEVTLNDACFMFGANDLIKQKYSLLCACVHKETTGKEPHSLIKAFVLRVEKHSPSLGNQCWEEDRAKHMEMRMHNTWMPNTGFLSSANIRSQS